MLHYEPGLGSWTYDFLDEFFDTNIRIGIPYVINKEMYLRVLEEYGAESNFRDTDIVTFSADVIYEDKEGDIIYGETLPKEYRLAHFSFFVNPKGSPEGSHDFYDCIQFGYGDEKTGLEKYEEFILEVLKCVKHPSVQHCKNLVEEKLQKIEKISHEISELNKIIY